MKQIFLEGESPTLSEKKLKKGKILQRSTEVISVFFLYWKKTKSRNFFLHFFRKPDQRQLQTP